MTIPRPLSRRSFLKSSAAAAGSIAAPLYVPSTVFGANERIVTGHIGTGEQGRGDMNGFLHRGVQVAAICDVDQRHLRLARQEIDQVQASLGRRAVTKTVDEYGDFRRLLDRKDIDAVVVVTPDHWHSIPTILACDAGKDVYCEKPLSLTIEEGRKMVDAARRNKRVVQTGTQQRSSENFRIACELVQNGYLGELREIQIGIPQVKFRFFNLKGKPRFDHGERAADSAPPAGFDYDFWVGPSEMRPYNLNENHYNFRYFLNYASGQMTNWGAHNIDIAQWAMDADDGGPVSAVAESVEYEGRKTGLYDVSSACRVTMEYANGVQLKIGQWRENDPACEYESGGNRFIGTKGEILVNRDKLEATPGELLEIKLNSTDKQLVRSDDHINNFLECIKSRNKPISDVEIGHRSTTVCNVATIALKLGPERKLTWDPVKEEFPGDAEANALRSRPLRKPYDLI
ncbi:MAG: Gfo/Idh/MocA family protein [Planctomycetaceae bacterium]